MSVINVTSRYLDQLWELRDKRLDGYPFMSQYKHTIFMCLGYLVLVKIVGPIYMRTVRNGRPYDLRSPMLVYNACQVCYSSFQARWTMYNYIILFFARAPFEPISIPPFIVRVTILIYFIKYQAHTLATRDLVIVQSLYSVDASSFYPESV